MSFIHIGRVNKTSKSRWDDRAKNNLHSTALVLTESIYKVTYDQVSFSIKKDFFAEMNRLGGQSLKQQRFPPYVYYSVFATTALGATLYYMYLDEVPVTKRRRWIATTPEAERRLGDQEYHKLLHAYREDLLPKSHRASETVHRVGSRLADASFQFAKENNIPVTQRPYTFHVIRSDMANAFALPGQHVFVFTGIFRFVRNEDDLAAILSHEIAHCLVRHSGEKISGSILFTLLGQLALVIDPSGALFYFLSPATKLLRELPNSRQQEMEADQIGVQLAAEACFDPRAAKRVFSAMNSEGGAAGPPEFLSTHPSHSSRIAKFDAWLPSAMNIYEGDTGTRCYGLRRQMSVARQHAARQAALREVKRAETKMHSYR